MEKKIALVTGASSGIGKAIAIELANSGFEVIINFSKSKEKAKEVQREITQRGGQAQIFQADITSEKDISELFNFINQSFQKLDILVNNAGIYIPDFIESQKIESWDKVLDLNLKSKFLCTKYAI